MPWDPRQARIKPVENRVENLEQSQGAIVLNTPPPTASAPTEGLPADAVPGRFYTFASQPGKYYTLGADYVWYALIAVRVV